ncbi:MAG: hypothetical protein JWP00_693 [Chloroflexi bacterium]|jgi:uncharacterized protein|nr:hypothetical protein [Chloroflexota bacterium]
MKNEENNSGKNNSISPRPSRFKFSNNRLEPAPAREPAHREHQRVPEPVLPSQPHLTGRKHQHTEKTGPLIFNLATLLRDFEGAHRDYDFEQEVLNMAQEEGEKPAEARNITGRVRFTKVRDTVLAQGQGEADVVLECVRCLNDFDYHVDYELEEVFRPLIDVTTGFPIKSETLEEETDLKLDANHLLNLGEAIRQQILVSLPINPLCGEDCPGLYNQLERINETDPEADIDEPDEEVEPEIVDKRWAALSKLLKDTPES